MSSVNNLCYSGILIQSECLGGTKKPKKLWDVTVQQFSVLVLFKL